MNLKKFKSNLFRNEVTTKFLRILGFEPSISDDVLCFSFDKPIKRIMMARETLVMKIASKLESKKVNNLEKKIGFPLF